MDDSERALEVDILAVSLRTDKDAAGDLLEHLAGKLSQALPEEVQVSRGGWMFSSKKPVEELNIKLGEVGFQFRRDKRGVITAMRQKIVRGVVLKSEEVAVESLIDELAAQLAKVAEKNARTRDALTKFVIG